MVVRNLLLFFILSILGLPTSAEETDFIHDRNLPDISVSLDQKMNQALQEISDQSRTCKPDHLHRDLLNRLGGWGWSEIEKWAKQENHHGKVLRRKDSIYRRLPGGIWGCCSPSLNYQDNIISGDKLGHFLHSGYEMWIFAKNVKGGQIPDRRGLFSKTFDLFAYTTTVSFQELYTRVSEYQSTGEPNLSEIQWALELSLAQENGWWGWVGTGVKSFGDIAANMEGFAFWSELTEGKNPYYRCRNKKWALVRPFSWSHYVTPAWDEGINCNQYSNAANGRILKGQCPVDRSRCQIIIDRYKDLPAMISTDCF